MGSKGVRLGQFVIRGARKSTICLIFLIQLEKSQLICKSVSRKSQFPVVLFSCSGKMSGNRQVLSFHESLLRESDIALLRGPHWLNDQIISFYFEYLERNVHEETQEFLFVSPEVTQCLKIVSSDEASVFLSPLKAPDRDFIFFALNDNENTTAGGSHWSLLVLSRPENTFFHFDSSSGSNMASSRRFVAHLKAPLGCPGADLVQHPCLQQTNCYDCGIHLICTAEKVALHALQCARVSNPPEVHPEQVSRKRREILEIIRRLGGDL